MKRRVVFSKSSKGIHFILVLGSVLLTGTLIEGAFRLVIGYGYPDLAEQIQYHATKSTHENTSENYTPHPYLSYRSAALSYENDGIRIRDKFFSRKKNPRLYRIACCGGSTTMNQFTPFLQRDLEHYSMGQSFEVMDFGCNGWTLMESLINYLVRITDFSPDVVLIHHGMNDALPCLWPDFKPDYSHYRLSWQDQGSWLDHPLLSYSWIFSFIQIKRGTPRTSLQNYTVRRINKESLAEKLPQEGLENYKRLLQQFFQLLHANKTKVIFAPMAYCPGKQAPRFEKAVEQLNACAREEAKLQNVPLAETGSILKNFPELFLDMIHVNDRGNQIKSKIFARIICDSITGRKNPNVPLNGDTKHKHDLTHWIERKLEISWDDNHEGINDYHVYVYSDFENKYVYLGQTKRGDRHTLTWEPGSPLMADSFQEGPAIEKKYRFQVYAIPEKTPPPFYGPFAVSRVVER